MRFTVKSSGCAAVLINEDDPSVTTAPKQPFAQYTLIFCSSSAVRQLRLGRCWGIRFCPNSDDLPLLFLPVRDKARCFAHRFRHRCIYNELIPHCRREIPGGIVDFPVMKAQRIGCRDKLTIHQFTVCHKNLLPVRFCKKYAEKQSGLGIRFFVSIIRKTHSCCRMDIFSAAGHTFFRRFQVGSTSLRGGWGSLLFCGKR